MNTYHKINSIYKRNPDNMKEMLFGEYSRPEFEYLQDNQWFFREKIDGTNIRLIWDGEKRYIRGKTDNADLYPGLVKSIMDLIPSQRMHDLYHGQPMTIYGEGYGAKIRSGGDYIPDGQSFIAFDVKIGDKWLSRENVLDITGKLKIPTTPIVGIGTLDQGIEMVYRGFYSEIAQRPNTLAEGIVAVPVVELLNSNGARIITKIKHRDFGTF